MEEDGDSVTSSRGWSPTMTEAAARTLGARRASRHETWLWQMRLRTRARASEVTANPARSFPTC